MRACDPPVLYLVGTPKGRLTRYEKQMLEKPWHEARSGVQVKLVPQDGELYVLALEAAQGAFGNAAHALRAAYEARWRALRGQGGMAACCRRSRGEGCFVQL